MTQARIRIDPELAGLTRTDWENLIFEANLGREWTELAQRYYLDKECQIDLAEDIRVGHRTINRQIKKIKLQLIETRRRSIPS